jgi:hypothetical protein
MSTSNAAIAIRTQPSLGQPVQSMLRPAPSLLLRPPATRRTKIWEFNTNLHCSIIGTCLSTLELRNLLKRFQLATLGSTDHELHGIGVSLAARNDEPGRHLHKTLDRCHKLAINQFAKAETADQVRSLWRAAVQAGEIPGAYWAALTHPATDQAIIREAFGEVHMLSHLVGSANRADIRRLSLLETEKSALEEKLQRQQLAFHDTVKERDSQIGALRAALAEQPAHEAPLNASDESNALRAVVADLERRLTRETARRIASEQRLAAACEQQAREHCARAAAESDSASMQAELTSIEAYLRDVAVPEPHRDQRLDAQTVLYVGGRPNQIPAMRAAVERLGAVMLSHDGGIEDHPSLLAGLISRSDVVCFPVDCVSHDAVLNIKAVCRQTGKRFVPLRSASLTTLLGALCEPERVSP